MGQYYIIVNLDKKQYLGPHTFSDGIKLMEFACENGGTMTALAVLLAESNGRGGGDIHATSPLIGSWAGDRIVVAGDYADEGTFVTGKTLYVEAHEVYENISEKILDVICEDEEVRRMQDKKRL